MDTDPNVGTTGHAAARRPRRRVHRYLISLPERMSARRDRRSLGGAVYETSNVALPRALRESKLYQVTIDRLLRITDRVGRRRARRLSGRGDSGRRSWPRASSPATSLELASIFAVGFSPLWLLAAASDVMGGSKAYLRALVAELEAAGHLPQDTDVASYEELLGRLETGSGVLADAIDVPPMSVREARASFDDAAPAGERSALRPRTWRRSSARCRRSRSEKGGR